MTAQVFLLAFFAAEVRAWRGEERLWKVFWAYGVGSSSVLAIFYAAAVFSAHIVLQQILLLCFTAYKIWILVSVWRCAKNTQAPLWGLLARFLTVAWACNAIMVLTFLQLDLAMRVLGQ